MRFDLSDEPPEAIMVDLRRAGWSLGDARFGDTWTVSGTNGENVILACGKTVEDTCLESTVEVQNFVRETGRLPDVTPP